MPLEILATLCAGLFAGAAIYINVAEHPARLACGSAAAVGQFVPSYRRAAVMQASLAILGTLSALVEWWHGGPTQLLVGGVLLGAVVPFTLLVIAPTNRRLLGSSLDAGSAEAAALLRRWGWLHAVRSVLGVGAFTTLLASVATP